MSKQIFRAFFMLVFAVLVLPSACLAQEPPPVVEKCIEDLRQRLETAPEEITVVRWEETTWSDTSLGCPEPGMMYAQVLVEGYIVILSANGENHRYHTDHKGRVVYCNRPEQPDMENLPDVIERSRDDLAQRLGVESAEITVVELEERDWPNPALGFPEPGMMYPAVIVPGYRVVFEVRGRQYLYHTTRTRGFRYGGRLDRPATGGREYRLAVLTRAAVADGNNLWDLAARPFTDLDDEQIVLVPNVSDYAFSPMKNRLLIVRRTSRSGQDLIGMQGGDTRPLLSGFAVTGLSWADDGERYALWLREGIAGPWRLMVGRAMEEPRPVSAGYAPVPSAVRWQGERIAFTVPDGDGNLVSFIQDVAETWAPLRLECGRFITWLHSEGMFLAISGDTVRVCRLSDGGVQHLREGDIAGLAWAAPLASGRRAAAIAINDDELELVLLNPAAHLRTRHVTSLYGQLAGASLSPCGRYVMVETIPPEEVDGGYYTLALVDMASGRVERVENPQATGPRLVTRDMVDFFTENAGEQPLH